MPSRRLFDGAQEELGILPIVGAVAPGVITGDLAATETGSDTFAATGGSASSITGTLDATETGADSFAATGQVLVQGTLAATESGADAFAASGIVRITGTLAATETGSDTFTATGGSASSITGTLAATETGADSFAATGQVRVQGNLAANESGADSFAATGDTVFYSISARQALRLLQLHRLHGLDAAAPLVVSPTGRAAGDLSQTVIDASGTVTIATVAGPSTFAGNAGQMIDDLAALHGLTDDLIVTPSSRTAGSISQTIAVAGSTTTVARSA